MPFVIVVPIGADRHHGPVGTQADGNPAKVACRLTVNVPTQLFPADRGSGGVALVPLEHTHMSFVTAVLVCPDRHDHAVGAQTDRCSTVILVRVAVNVLTQLFPAECDTRVPLEHAHLSCPPSSVYVLMRTDRHYHTVGAQADRISALVARRVAVNVQTDLPDTFAANAYSGTAANYTIAVASRAVAAPNTTNILHARQRVHTDVPCPISTVVVPSRSDRQRAAVRAQADNPTFVARRIADEFRQLSPAETLVSSEHTHFAPRRIVPIASLT